MRGIRAERSHAFTGGGVHMIMRDRPKVADVLNLPRNGVDRASRLVVRDADFLGPERQPHFLSDGDRFGASCLEFVSVVGVDLDAALGCGRNLALEHVHVADEARDIACLRIFVDIARRRDLHQIALVHDGDPACDRHRFFLVVRHDDESRARRFLNAHQLELRLLAKLLVERAQGLVEQDDARFLGDGACQRDALLLAA